VASRTPTQLIPPDLPVDASQLRVSPLVWVPHLGAAVAAVKGAGAVAVVRLVAVAMDVPPPPPSPSPPPPPLSPSLAGGAAGGKCRRGGRRAYGLWVERLVAGGGGRVAGAVVAPAGGGGGGGSSGGDGRGGRWRARDAVLRVLTADGQLGCFLLEREDWGGLADDSRLALV